MRLDINYNSPVVLSYTFLAITVMTLASLGLGGVLSLFTLPAHFTSTNILDYFRLFSHVAGHANWAHLFGNFTIILLVGPILEEKYGSKSLLLMILITAVVTGILHSLFFSNGLLGASGVVFMMIILSSFTNQHGKGIPLTFILVAVIFLGKEVNDMFKNDNVSQFAHIIGGMSGAFFGFLRTKNLT